MTPGFPSLVPPGADGTITRLESTRKEEVWYMRSVLLGLGRIRRCVALGREIWPGGSCFHTGDTDMTLRINYLGRTHGLTKEGHGYLGGCGHLRQEWREKSLQRSPGNVGHRILTEKPECLIPGLTPFGCRGFLVEV